MKRLIYISVGILIMTLVFTPIPSPELDYSKVLYDQDGQLLSAKIAEDGQWRFPYDGPVPKSLVECVRLYEDEYFYHHPGVNPVSIVKALKANIKAGRTVRGGSTITMQVMRMFHRNKPRTLLQKLKETLGAIKLEIIYPKKDIMKMWTSMAPFGGNTVGAQTAARRYYGRDIDNLSWAEYATLAVLPNNPSYIHVHKNIEALKAKRDFLLQKLFEKEIIDEDNYRLAIDEEISVHRYEIPQDAFHALEFLVREHPEESLFHTHLNQNLQRTAQEVVNEYSDIFKKDGIDNMAAIIIDHKSDQVVAYVGNSISEKGNIQFVDCAQGLRSYGSLLKPFLYTYAIDQGYFTPRELVKDIPTSIGGFYPKNFDRRFRGVVPFSEMVSSSLNVPAVRILNYVGLESFHHHLRDNLGLISIHPDANHHGLSLILGGAEASLWEMMRLYKGLLRNHNEQDHPFGESQLLADHKEKMSSDNATVYHPLSIWYALKAMMSLERPKEEQQFMKMGGNHIAWKTGTSYGHRDAWAIGANSDYIVGVWVGNEDGHGMHDLTGVKRAAPVLFRLFRHLGGNEIPEHKTEARSTMICKQSGMLAGIKCEEKEQIFLPSISHRLRNCDHHKATASGKMAFQIHPVADYYHEQFYGNSINKEDVEIDEKVINLVYPEADAILKVPKKLDAEYAKITARASTNYTDAKLFWYLDDRFLTTTSEQHDIQIDIEDGDHRLYVSDMHGNEQMVSFQVVKN